MEGVAFERPWALGVGVLLAAAVLLLAIRRRPADLAPARHAAAASLRATAILLAAVVAAGPSGPSPGTANHRLLVAAAGPVDVPSGAAGEDVILRGGTSVPRAVAAAMASRGADSADRLLVLAGDEGPGEASAADAVRVAAATGLPVLVAALPPAAPAPNPPAAKRPALRGLVLPTTPAAGVPFRIGFDLDPSARAEAGLVAEVSVDGAAPLTAAASAGGASLVLAAGPHLVSATLRGADGTPRGFASAVLEVPGPPSVLVVEEGTAPSPFARALRAQGVPVETAAPGKEDAATERASVIVLGAGAAGSAAVERAVRNGRGLLVLGAPTDARGLGRLRDSPVARALPIFLPPPPAPGAPPAPPEPPDPDPPKNDGPGIREEEGERPGAVVTLLLLVDASGSMGGLKIEMARRAAAAAASTLSPEDRFGMLSFADAPRWEIPLGPAADSTRLDRALRSLDASGGTHLLPALQEARRALRRESTAVRHLVVLSDGETPPFGLRAEVEGLVSEGATLSSVGIGSEFDARLLGNLASWGRGRTWPAVDPSRIPQVVTMDTQRVVEAGREALKKAKPTDLPVTDPKTTRPDPPKETAVPPAPPARVAVVAADPSALLEGLGPWPPAVPPEAAPEARLATTLALRFDGDAGPALVLGRHGLGRTAVLVADPADWAGWDGFAPFAARLARGLAPAVGGPPVELLGTEPGPSGTRVRFEMRGGEGAATEPRVTALDPRGDTPSPVAVEREGARRFAALVPPGPVGPRTVVVRAGDAASPGIPLAWFDGGPPEPSPPDPDAPRRLAAAAGVPFVEGALPPPPPAPARPGRRVPAGWTLAALSALLLAADTALRRSGRGG